MDINLELYKVFYTVVRSGSISKASLELFISQPAVSQSIRQLETKLGGRLFFRTPKGIKLTPEGEVLYKYIAQGYNMILLAENKFSEAINLDAGEIRIGASDMTLKYFLLPHLEEFHKRYPKVRIKVTNGPSPETVACLKSGMIDFGVASLPLLDNSAVDVINAMEIQDCFIANYKYGHLASRKTALAELSDYPVIMLEKNTSTRRYIDNFLTSKGVALVPEIELATSDLLVQFARRGLGISCVVRNFAEIDLENGSLFELDLADKIPPRQIGIIKLNNTPLSAAAVKFIELIDIS
ncbi:MAG: LysR family transcriptional regulator [Ruminiclostridium sp.]|nr:LysR family transcriptional regulator [Ruminiclostridium sp.]